MAKSLKDAKLGDINNFEGLTDSLMKYLDKYWDCDVKPKGYDEFMGDYETYDGLPIETPNEFDGFDTGDACVGGFESRTAIPNIAYNDSEQGRSPLESLVGSIFAYGLVVGEARGKKKLADSMLMRRLERQIKQVVDNAKDGTTTDFDKVILGYIKDDLNELKNELK